MMTILINVFKNKLCLLGWLQRELGACQQTGSQTQTVSTQATASIDASESQDSSTKRQRTSLFRHYKSTVSGSSLASDHLSPAHLLRQYLQHIEAVDTSFEMVFAGFQYTVLGSLFERVFCVPASSAPVERVFSQSGLIMRPNRARMSDTVLEELMFLKCNE